MKKKFLLLITYFLFSINNTGVVESRPTDNVSLIPILDSIRNCKKEKFRGEKERHIQMIKIRSPRILEFYPEIISNMQVFALKCSRNEIVNIYQYSFSENKVARIFKRLMKSTLSLDLNLFDEYSVYEVPKKEEFENVYLIDNTVIIINYKVNNIVHEKLIKHDNSNQSLTQNILDKLSTTLNCKSNKKSIWCKTTNWNIGNSIPKCDQKKCRYIGITVKIREEDNLSEALKKSHVSTLIIEQLDKKPVLGSIYEVKVEDYMPEHFLRIDPIEVEKHQIKLNSLLTGLTNHLLSNENKTFHIDKDINQSIKYFKAKYKLIPQKISFAIKMRYVDAEIRLIKKDIISIESSLTTNAIYISIFTSNFE
ncbi:MAG: hypothetical protein ABUK01_07595 [Leptospirales bacterium]